MPLAVIINGLHVDLALPGNNKVQLHGSFSTRNQRKEKLLLLGMIQEYSNKLQVFQQMLDTY